MRERNTTRLVMLLLFASFAAAPATARATEEFPWSIRRDLALDYEPPCALCHENGMTGTGTVRTPFGMSMRLRGMIAGNDDSLAKALDAMAADNVDSDHDGVSDIEELKSHTDPNRYGALPLDQANEPTYGCGGTIARSPRGTGAATGAMLLSALALSIRRRRWRPSRREWSLLDRPCSLGCLTSMSRGPHPDDPQLFSAARVPVLRRAAEEVSWLLGRGYSPETAIAAAGNHHQLALRQRVAVARSCSSDQSRARRLGRRCRAEQAEGKTLQVDGFNLVIALEVACAGGVLVRGREGALRDLAGLRGTYHVTEDTGPALSLVGLLLEEHPPASMRWLLDRRVSNSGRLKALIESVSSAWSFAVTVELVPDPDPILAQLDWVVTADAMILERCGPWVNLASEVIGRHIPGAWVVDLAV